MLGRLRMTVEESLGVFEEFGEEVFGHSRFLDRILQPFTYKYSSERLRNGIEKVVQKHGRAEGDREWKRDMFPANENKCKTAVVVRKVSEKTSNIEVFRTYDTAYQPATNVPTHLIALATASSPLYFPPVLINDNRYQDPAVSGFNNPSFIALKEARQEFELSEKNTGAFVSVGSGHRDPDYSSFGSISVGTSFVWHLGALASNTRRLITRVDHQDLLMRFAKHPNYYRFSSTHLIGSLPLDDWRGRRGSKTLDYITYLTSAYLGTDEVRDALKKCAKRLVERRREEKALVPDHTSALSNDHDRGIMYREQGKLDYAEQMFKQALAGQEEVLGSDHISTLRTANNLGDLYREQDQLDKAEQMYRKVLSGREKVLGLDHTSTLDTVNNLGNLYRDQGRLDEAEQMYMRAIAGQAKALGPDHTLTLRAVNNLGDLYREQGQLDKAEKMYVQALAGQETTLGPDHILTLRTVNNLGVLYYEQGKLDETEQMYLRVLAGYEKVLGFDHMSTLRIINNIGVIYHDQGKLDEAAQMYQRALAGYEKVLGPYHETHASSLAIVNNLGNLYKNQGKLKKAEEMYQRALEGSEKALGPHHTSTLNAVNNLGNLYKNQGRLNEAEELYQRVPAWQGEGSRAGSQQDAATKRRLMG
ncbi:hypothetical protein CAN33_0030270 [Aspergillus niger]|uniref:PNPLA domain-containing protein n=2 Tax=Aspergillus niger TaxID=5061 RepID=A0A254UHN6_ASPNG|nr:hypothetical protein CBS147345_9232 [Aspergillus niger]TPR04545.1 hypothetical protein CAN33_0030270 [Aspergillus niger]SPB51397.1 unnamed protein product [Aspergillus niger]